MYHVEIKYFLDDRDLDWLVSKSIDDYSVYLTKRHTASFQFDRLSDAMWFYLIWA